PPLSPPAAAARADEARAGRRLPRGRAARRRRSRPRRARRRGHRERRGSGGAGGGRPWRRSRAAGPADGVALVVGAAATLRPPAPAAPRVARRPREGRRAGRGDWSGGRRGRLRVAARDAALVAGGGGTRVRLRDRADGRAAGLGPAALLSPDAAGRRDVERAA